MSRRRVASLQSELQIAALQIELQAQEIRALKAERQLEEAGERAKKLEEEIKALRNRILLPTVSQWSSLLCKHILRMALREGERYVGGVLRGRVMAAVGR